MDQDEAEQLATLRAAPETREPFDEAQYVNNFDDDQELQADRSASRKARQIVTLTKYNMHIADVEIKFEFLICDEAHVLRDPRRRTSRACMMVNAVSTVMITATPMLNQVDDISGLMMQGWRRAKFYDFSLPEDVPWEYLVDDRFKMVDIKLPDVKDLQKIPSMEFRSTRTDEDVLHNNKLITMAMLWYPDDKGYSDRAELQQWSLRTGKRWWLLHPTCVHLVSGLRLTKENLSGKIYQELQALIMVRNRLNDHINLPDGTQAFPRDAMPAMKLTYVQCSYPKAWAERVSAMTTQFLRILPAAGDLDENSAVGAIHTVTNDELMNKKLRDQHKTSSAMRTLMLIHRVLSLMSLDVRQAEVAMGCETQESIQARLDMLPDERKEYLFGLDASDKSEHGRVRETLRKLGEESTDGGPRMGSAFAQQMTEQHPAGGLPLVWMLSRETHLGIPPTARFEMVLWAINKSPAMQAMLDITARAVKAGERVLLVVNQPWIQT